MKSIIKVLLLVGLFVPRIATAQGTVTYASNLEQASTGSLALGSDFWLAAAFGTGSNPGGYSLDSIQLAMNDASGNPSGFTVSIYSSTSITALLPGSSLGTLIGSSDPSTGGTYTYTASDFTLLPRTSYFIVLKSGTAVANGAFEWSNTDTHNYNLNGGWNATVFGHSANGSSWILVAEAPQFAVNATALPEPGVAGLFALGGLLIGFRCWRARAVNEKKSRRLTSHLPS